MLGLLAWLYLQANLTLYLVELNVVRVNSSGRGWSRAADRLRRHPHLWPRARPASASLTWRSRYGGGPDPTARRQSEQLVRTQGFPGGSAPARMRCSRHPDHPVRRAHVTSLVPLVRPPSPEPRVPGHRRARRRDGRVQRVSPQRIRTQRTSREPQPAPRPRCRRPAPRETGGRDRRVPRHPVRGAAGGPAGWAPPSRPRPGPGSGQRRRSRRTAPQPARVRARRARPRTPLPERLRARQGSRQPPAGHGLDPRRRLRRRRERRLQPECPGGERG